MQHPFAELAAEYEHLLSIMQVTRQHDVEGIALKLNRFKSRYAPVSKETSVPIPVIATFHQRESSADFSTNLAQGDPLTRPSTHVPAGRPKLGAPPNDHFPVTWEYAAIDAINYDHLNDLSVEKWSLSYACWKGEAWNGFGPRNHGRHTGYLWGGTNIYDGGKYVCDGVWEPNFQDPQIGIVPVILKMIELDPILAFGQSVTQSAVPLLIPTTLPTPLGVGADHDGWGTKEIQHALNALDYGPLLEDGNYGRRTREAVRAFQRNSGLLPDGLAGDQTIPALKLEYKLSCLSGLDTQTQNADRGL